MENESKRQDPEKSQVLVLAESEVGKVRQIAPFESFEKHVVDNIVNIFKFGNYICARVRLNDEIDNYRVFDKVSDSLYGYATLEREEYYDNEGNVRKIRVSGLVVCVPATNVMARELPYLATVEVLKYAIRREMTERLLKILEKMKR